MAKQEEEKQKEMDWKRYGPVLWTLVIVLVIAAMVQAYQLSVIGRQIASDSAGVKIDLTNMKQAIGKLDTSVTNIELDTGKAKENTAQLWYATIPKASVDKITEWYDKNLKFLTNCPDVGLVSVSNGFMGYGGALGDTLILEYPEQGYQVINRDGSVKCYEFPIVNLTPSESRCSTLCQTPSGGEVAQ